MANFNRITNDEYRYAEILEAAKADPSDSNMNRLGQWFQDYGTQFWNGETYEVDRYTALRPVYAENPDGDYDITGYEFC